MGHSPAASEHPALLVGNGELCRWETLWEVLVRARQGIGWRKLVCVNGGPNCKDFFFPLVCGAHIEITHSGSISLFKGEKEKKKKRRKEKTKKKKKTREKDRKHLLLLFPSTVLIQY